MEARGRPAVWGHPWPHWYIEYALICFFSPINACILRILSYKVVNFGYANQGWREGSPLITLVWNIFSWSFHILSVNWIHLVTCSKTEFHELHCCSRCTLDKIKYFYCNICISSARCKCTIYIFTQKSIKVVIRTVFINMTVLLSMQPIKAQVFLLARGSYQNV